MNRFQMKQDARRERFASLSSNAAAIGAALMNRAKDMAAALAYGQPEPIHAGHGLRMHRTYAQGLTAQQRASHWAKKAERVGSRGISSDDPQALAKLAGELADLDAAHERMKAANRAIRRHADRAAQVASLVDLGFSEAKALDLLAKDTLGRMGFPAHALQKNRAQAGRVRDRIEEIQSLRDRADVVLHGPGYEYREDVQDNRVKFTFLVKPDADTRALLHRYAFKLSPSREGQPWVRQMTAAAIQAGAQLRAEIDKLNAHQ